MAAALAALAIAFNLAFIHWATDHVVTRVSATHIYSSTHSIQATLLNVWSVSVADLRCLRLPCVAASASMSGLYPQDGVSPAAAALLGIMLPDILFVAAAVFLLNSAAGRSRAIFGVIVVALGLLIVAPFGLLTSSTQEGVSRDIIPLMVPWLIALTGLMLTAIGMRAIFTRGQSTQ